MFRSGLVAVVLIVLSSGAQLASAQTDYGFDVQKTAKDSNEGVTAGDFYTLVDDALGSNFGSLVMVFGGCYSGGFADKLADSKVGKSGKPVAVLTATNRKEASQCTPAGVNGAPFFNGAIGGFVDSTGTGKVSNPVSDAFSSGEASVKNFTEKEVIKKKLNEEGKVAIPPSQPDHAWLGGGEKITLDGKDKDHKHAILFMGKPQTVFDWNDLINSYQTLVDAGFRDIQVFFGTAELAKDGTYRLTNDDFTPGISVERDSAAYDTPRPIKVLSEISKDGKVTGIVPRAADFEHLKAAILAWRGIANTAGHADDQFFIAVGTHSTNAAKVRDKKELEFPPAKPSSANASGGGGTPKKTATGGQAPRKKGKIAGGGPQAPTVVIGIGIGGGRDRTDTPDNAKLVHGSTANKTKPVGHPSCHFGPESC